MGQISFSDAEYAGKRKKTRREVFLEEMDQVVPWKALLGLIEPHYPVAGRGRRPQRRAQSPTQPSQSGSSPSPTRVETMGKPSPVMRQFRVVCRQGHFTKKKPRTGARGRV